MSKTNFLLLALLLASALATVASTHRSRKLFIALENAQAEQKRIEVEWGQLQLEQSTWAKHALVEGIATRQLGMRTPDAARTQFVTPGPAIQRDGGAKP
jgi:cell division protein FtsL